MRFNMKIGAIAMATVMALSAGAVGVSQVWAQDTGTATAESDTQAGLAGIRQEVRQAGLEAAAGVLGMSAADLEDQLWGGKTLADLAEAKNVPLSDVRDAVEKATTAARQDAVKKFIAQQVQNGRITQDEADWITQGIDKGWFGGVRRFLGNFDGMGGDGFGLGGGLGGGRQFGMGMGAGRMRMHGQAPEQPAEQDK